MLYKLIAAVEERHKIVFQYLHEAVRTGTLYQCEHPVLWVCSECGHAHVGTEAFKVCPLCKAKGEKFDVVILDPPAFTKSRNSIKNAVKGYREINVRGLKLVRDGGFLVTCSCSHFMDPDLFAKTIREAANGAHKRLRQVEFRTQTCDHPILGAADQSYYLKFYIFQVVEEK